MAGSAPKSHARRTLLVLATISLTAAMLVVLVPAARATTCRVGNPTVGIHSSDLQAMIDASSPGHTLRLSGTWLGNLTISKDLNLLGVRLDPTLDGNASGSVSSVNSDALVAVRNLAITNGNAALGGGIDVEGGSVSLIDASVTDNKATNGGVIFNIAGRSSCAMATNHL